VGKSGSVSLGITATKSDPAPRSAGNASVAKANCAEKGFAARRQKQMRRATGLELAKRDNTTVPPNNSRVAENGRERYRGAQRYDKRQKASGGVDRRASEERR
jgi:hypothetical protein